MTTSRTTVVIATRDRAGELARTLNELLSLRPRPPIIVLDNASQDDTAERVHALRNDVAGVRLIQLPRDAGAAARNIGVAVAATPYVAFSDDDSWWAPDALPIAEKVLDSHPEVGLLAATTLVGPEERPDPVTRLLAGSPLGHRSGLPGPSVLGFLACAAVVRKRAYLEAGGFNRVLHFGAEEKLLAFDLAARGWELCYVAELRAHHHPSTARPANAYRRHLEARNNALIVWMRRPFRHCAAAAAGLVLGVVLDPGSLPAVAGAFRRLPRALAQRQLLPPEVERQIRVLKRGR
jgi:glycosyltransferase involved in cell wall biosynthesis